jgi:hypothetical protein
MNKLYSIHIEKKMEEITSNNESQCFHSEGVNWKILFIGSYIDLTAKKKMPGSVGKVICEYSMHSYPFVVLHSKWCLFLSSGQSSASLIQGRERLIQRREKRETEREGMRREREREISKGERRERSRRKKRKRDRERE